MRKNWNLGTRWRSNQKVTKFTKIRANKFFPLILESRTKLPLCKNRLLFFLPHSCVSLKIDQCDPAQILLKIQAVLIRMGNSWGDRVLGGRKVPCRPCGWWLDSALNVTTLWVTEVSMIYEYWSNLSLHIRY